MAVIGIGQQLVLMQGFARQKAISTNPKKRARSLHFRRFVVPSLTRESAQARLCLAKAAHGAFGKSFEEVIAAVQSSCAGKNYGGARKKEVLRNARHKAASASISMLQRAAGDRRRTPR